MRKRRKNRCLNELHVLPTRKIYFLVIIVYKVVSPKIVEDAGYILKNKIKIYYVLLLKFIGNNKAGREKL